MHIPGIHTSHNDLFISCKKKLNGDCSSPAQGSALLVTGDGHGQSAEEMKTCRQVKTAAHHVLCTGFTGLRFACRQGLTTTFAHNEKFGYKKKIPVEMLPLPVQKTICELWESCFPTGFGYNGMAIFPACTNALYIDVYFCEHTENCPRAFAMYLTLAANKQTAKK